MYGKRKQRVQKRQKEAKKRKAKVAKKVVWVAYILLCADKSLYIGSTNNVAKRLHAHNHLKSGAHYTKIRRPVVLAYQESLPSFAKARAREAALKRLTRQAKLLLIQNTQQLVY